MFYKEARIYIGSLIRQRQHLIRSGVSLKNQDECEKYITELQNQLDFYQFNTDLKMAKFFERNQVKIKELIPVKNQPTATDIKYNQLLNKALNIINHAEPINTYITTHKASVSHLS